MRGSFRLLLRAIVLTVVLAGGAFFFLASLPYSEDTITRWPTSPVLLDGKGGVFAVFLSGDSEWSIPVPLDTMGKWLPLVAVEVEDRRFREHSGIDWTALLRATIQNARARRVVSGASTITSQLVRLSEPRQRTVKTKILEFTAAVKTERHFSKDRILELYLNRAPFGGNIRGVEAAARIYFSKSAAEVSLAEAALLVGMLRGPSVYRPDRNPEAAIGRRNAILTSLADRGVITQDQLTHALAEKLLPSKGNLPAKAWHFALAALGDRKEGGTIRTTLDSSVQALLERTLASALSSMPPEVTAAGIIMDNDTGDILAYLGNGRLGSGLPGSWVDCAGSPRSPGSALKPFAYLAAFDRGILTPSSLLADTPLAFSGQAPRNFDLTYRGPVTARTALADSLNVPAVRVLRAAGPELVLDLLRNAGFRSLVHPTGHYGDSLILGGCEVTLLQMAEAYGVLATLGIRRQPRFLAGEGLPERRILPEAAPFLVADILKDTGRLLPVHGRRIESRRDWFAFKTGTSYGYRDAWTAAYNPRHTVVVWMGDPSGGSHPELVGLSAAAPAIVEILRALPATDWYEPPPGVESRTVCTLSGAPPSPVCPSTRTEYAIAGISSTTPCTLHVIRNGSPAERWPAELEEFALRRSLEFETGRTVSIVSPLPGSRYFLTPLGGEQKTALKAEGAVPPVYWFVGGTFAGRQEGSIPLFWRLRKGRHTVSLVDSRGRTASSWVIVEAIEKGPEQRPGPSPLLLTPVD
ncbi:penicillin-binding protein 1C [Aminivibrio sp.]|uniref:penicillin-binding protein 1C n=1 Tax=Aminivibrio sp. TaxID=1872489 RepID=UPI001A43A6E0|nr:penicillin-binding protein 1C [Aminivibrio sp.]MBL3540089.1 penicillin-binding protein 1C [Aminivibrio sp.]